MSEELRPCPWCGRIEALSVETEANTCTGTTQHWYASVACICFDGDYCYPITATGATENEARDKAITDWNHRPTEDALRADLEQAKLKLRSAIQVVENIEGKVAMYDGKRRVAEAALEKAEAMCLALAEKLLGMGYYPGTEEYRVEIQKLLKLAAQEAAKRGEAPQ